MINEPSAAGFEYTHRLTKSLNSRRTRILVYDLGGGTFDASLVAADDKSHEVLGSRGDNNVGGDDFDVALASFALEKSGRGELAADEWQRLLDSARQAKESLYPQSRYVAVDVPGSSSPTSIPVKEFYDLVAPLIESTLATMEPRLSQDEDGASKLPDAVAGHNDRVALGLQGLCHPGRAGETTAPLTPRGRPLSAGPPRPTRRRDTRSRTGWRAASASSATARAAPSYPSIPCSAASSA